METKCVPCTICGGCICDGSDPCGSSEYCDCEPCPGCEEYNCTGCAKKHPKFPFWVSRTGKEEMTCENHNDFLHHDHGIHYGQCAYCIMSGYRWKEEWGGWGELAGRVVKIVEMGINDEVEGVNFHPQTSPDYFDGVNQFIKIYLQGRKLVRDFE